MQLNPFCLRRCNDVSARRSDECKSIIDKRADETSDLMMVSLGLCGTQAVSVCFASLHLFSEDQQFLSQAASRPIRRAKATRLRMARQYCSLRSSQMVHRMLDVGTVDVTWNRSLS